MNMIKLYLSGILLLLLASSIPTDGVRVKVKDEVGRVFKSPSLPSRLSVEVPDLEGDHVQLALHRNEDQGGTVPVFQLTTNGQGQMELEKLDVNVNLTLYQDRDNMASFAVIQKTDHKGTSTKLRGVIHKRNKVYDLKSSTSPLGVNDVDMTSPDNGEEFDLHVHRHDDETLVDKTDDKENAKYGTTSQGDNSRKTRAVTQDVHVEVVALVDYAVYSTWYNRSAGGTASERKQNALDDMYEYYAFVFDGMNMMYKTITSLSYTIHVTLSSVIVLMTPHDSPWTENHRVHEDGWRWDLVNSSAALNDLKDFAKTTHSLPPYDHLMLFTGYDLTNQSGAKSNLGRAFEGTVCDTDGQATSIIQDLGGLQCMLTSVHELGHGLGCNHDGENNTCVSDEGYIMSTGMYNLTETNKHNAWVFSHCSVNYINNYLSQTAQTTAGRNCLYRTLTMHGNVVDVTSHVPGQTYNIDQQCQQIRGPQSYFCRGMNESKLELHWDDVCNTIYCSEPLDDLCHSEEAAARGTTCGDHKWCVDGSCVHDALAPAVPDGCPFGETPGVVDDKMGLTCAQVASRQPVRCYRNWESRTCCSSCAKVVQHGKLPGQLYHVDEQCRQYLGQDSYMCRGVNRTLLNDHEEICDSLYCYNSTKDLCSNVITADGTTCGDHKWCENKVCVHNTSAPAVHDGCPFSDQQGVVDDGLTCKQIASQQPKRCFEDWVLRVCCSSCSSIYQPGQVAGQVYNVDQQCQQMYGPQSYLCRGVVNVMLSDKTFNCSKLSCYNVTDDLCYNGYASMGTTCGDGKWCTEALRHVEQKCVHNSSAPAVTDGCPLGDQPGVVTDGLTCSQIASSMPVYCYNDWVRVSCCKACATVYQPGKVAGQVYGVDAQCQMRHGPQSYMCRGVKGTLLANGTFDCSKLYCHNSTDDLCYSWHAAMGTSCDDGRWCTEGSRDQKPVCVHDTSAPAITRGCLFGDQPFGLTADGHAIQCDSYVSGQPSRCYDPQTASHCCASCAKHYSPAHNCEYGDKATGCAPQYCHITSNLPLCCATCHYTPPDA